jgi:hypothetical protein
VVVIDLTVFVDDAVYSARVEMTSGASHFNKLAESLEKQTVK